MSVFNRKRDGDEKARRRRRNATTMAIATLVVEAAALKLRTGKLAGNVVVRCRQGHLFTTIWIPGVSVKALRLGFWRIERCPVGRHWSVVTPVKESALAPDALRAAHEHHDLRVP